MTTSRSELEGQGTLEGMAFRNEVGERLKRLTEWSAFPRGRTFVTATGMSASLIGRVRSSAFRLSETAVSMSLAGSCFSTESALRPFHYGIHARANTTLEDASEDATIAEL